MKTNLIFFISVGMCLSIPTLLTHAQTWTHYSAKEQLTGSHYRGFAEDKYGNLWVGSDKGQVFKFDGSTWKRYTHEDGLVGIEIHCILSDLSGQIWFGGTGKGLCKFDGSKWISYSDKVNGNQVTAMALDKKGVIWFGTEKGVTSYDGNNWIHYNKKNGMIGNDVSCIAVDANNTKWIASLNAGVSSFNDTIWTTYTQDLYGLCSKDVRSIAVDPGGYIWFGTIQYGLSCFNGKSWLTYNTEFAIDCVQSMAVDQKGYKWWTTYNIGMNKFGSIDSSNTHLDWNKYYGSTPDGIRINGVLSIFIDSKGDKWLGTKKDGIFKLEDGGSPGFHMTGKY